MPTVAVVYYSAQGHTHALAGAVGDGARGVAGTTVELHRLRDADIQNGRWKDDAVLSALAAADAIVFGTPTYMGGSSAQLKAFIDACSGVWFKQGWKDKVAAGFTHSGGLSGDKLNTLQGLVVNAMQHGMIWVGPAVLVEGTAPEDVNRLSSFTGAMAQSVGGDPVSAGDVKTAAALGRRVAEATARWGKGT